MSYEEFRPPRTYIGCPVEFATSPTENVKCLGLVAKVGKQYVDVLCFFADGTLGKRKHCLHRTDPRCKGTPEIFQYDDRGVWELAESEKRVRELSARLDGIERMLTSMVDDIALLRNRSDQQPDSEPPKRTRAPRRKEPVLTG